MARFIAGARFLAGPMAGAARMPFLRFLGWNVLGAMLWCSIVITVGYLVGDELERAAQVAHLASYWMALVAFLLLAAIWVFWWRERKRTVARIVREFAYVDPRRQLFNAFWSSHVGHTALLVVSARCAAGRERR